MFTGNGIKLTGEDAFVQKATFSGTIISGDGLATLSEGIYFIVATAAASAFPAPALGGGAIEPGYFINVSATDVITPAIGDDVMLMTLTDKCDISSFTMEFTKTEIDTTTLCDAVKTYRNGKSDMSGTMEGVYKIGETDDPDAGFMRQFISVVKQDGDISMDLFTNVNEILIGVFYVNNDTSLADETYVIAAYVLNGFTMGAAQDAAQTFSSGFRFASFNEPVSDIPVKPAVYRIGDGTV